MKYIIKMNKEYTIGYCYGCVKQCQNVCGTQCIRDRTPN